MKKHYLFILPFLVLFSFFSTEIKAQVSKKAIGDFLNDSAVSTGHAGISIYEPATGKYLYNYNAEKNFLPSSTTKLFTLYAGMKYLGDSLKGMKILEDDTSLILIPTGDPTLLHPDFPDQRVIGYIKDKNKKTFLRLIDHVDKYGRGWAWDDYLEDFMPERSVMPLYGNLTHFNIGRRGFTFFPKVATPDRIAFLPYGNVDNSVASSAIPKRLSGSNAFIISSNGKDTEKISIPFITSDSLIARLLSDTLKKELTYLPIPWFESKDFEQFYTVKFFHSRPVDSLFRPMMFNSDNFFAEQTLLMVSNEKLGYMSDEDIIDTLLKNDFKDIPTKPRWVDGSGLSRYNLFSPKDFIYILVKLKNEFGWERIKNILPGGGEGTLAHYYEDLAGAIHAKTGSMSNNVSQGGYITTKKGKTLLFSVIINNFSGTGTAGRKAIERLIRSVINSN